ncbi:MAG TPA: SGNH/GDSL hydrolase family protein, partial [Pseudonocardia sp.]|nr:SGNH/GDSL hydrolase family protein [Pseudonocardia sp.]
QPSGPASGATTTNGFAYQLANRSAATGTGMRLVNFGCSGVTSTALLSDPGCLRDALAPGAPNYAGVPQAEAAEAFLRAHRTQVVLVSVVVGGNDVKPCLLTAQGTVRPDTVTCVADAVATLRSNLARLLVGVRVAVGPDVRVVGLTYPDMFLGAWVSGGPDGHEIATRSLPVFRDALNPTLRAEYVQAGASFVDITAASGAYGSMADSTVVPPYGPVPEPVAQACALTFYCEYGDPHPKTQGYTLIADLVRRTLPAS